MGVIINELDVVTAPPAEAGAAPAAAAPQGAAPPPPSLSLEELRNLLRHQAERAARLRAH